MKIVYRTIILAGALIALTSCGGRKSIDTAELAAHLDSAVSFSEELTELSGSEAEHYFMFNPGECDEIEAYISTKAVCEELAVIKTDNTAAAQNRLLDHVERLKEEYSVYRPEETAKLDNAVINTYKDTVVLIVAPDVEQAQEAYKTYLKN